MRNSGTIEELIWEVAQQDRAAFRALYELTAPKLFGCAMRILKDAQKSADALQETYLQIWRHAARFDAWKGAGEAWMISILRFRAIDIVRRDRSHAALMEHCDFDEIDNMNESNFVQDIPEMTITLRDCIEQMEADQRRALLEIHMNGFTGEEYANLHQIPLGTVKSRVRRGLKNLRTCMEQ